MERIQPPINSDFSEFKESDTLADDEFTSFETGNPLESSEAPLVVSDNEFDVFSPIAQTRELLLGIHDLPEPPFQIYKPKDGMEDSNIDLLDHLCGDTLFSQDQSFVWSRSAIKRLLTDCLIKHMDSPVKVNYEPIDIHVLLTYTEGLLIFCLYRYIKRNVVETSNGYSWSIDCTLP